MSTIEDQSVRDNLAVRTSILESQQQQMNTKLDRIIQSVDTISLKVDRLEQKAINAEELAKTAASNRANTNAAIIGAVALSVMSLIGWAILGAWELLHGTSSTPH